MPQPEPTTAAASTDAAQRRFFVKVIRDALEQHATPQPERPGCSICQGALAALNQLVPEEAETRGT